MTGKNRMNTILETVTITLGVTLFFAIIFLLATWKTIGDLGAINDDLREDLTIARNQRDAAWTEEDALRDVIASIASEGADCVLVNPHVRGCWPTGDPSLSAFPAERGDPLSVAFAPVTPSAITGIPTYQERRTDAIIWCYDLGVPVGAMQSCVQMFIEGNP